MDVIRPLQRPGTVRGPADWFTGEVWIDAVSTGPHVRLLTVRSAPGARAAWHAHPFGQTIYVTEGAGLAQSRGGDIEPIRAGDIVFFAPNEDHWHGAGPDTFMSHLEMQEVADDGSDAVWGDQVTDAEYSPDHFS
jgi:quercetin dioxygenase-like cupin family protein